MIKLMQTLTLICSLLTMGMVTYMSQVVRPKIITFTIHKIDTIYKDKVIVKTLYRDTSDSQFMKAILEAECRYITKKRRGQTVYPPVGDGGKAIGIFQMHEIYFNGSTIAPIKGFVYEDMFDEKKATAVFWAKMGVYAYRYKKEYKRLPTFKELASIHNAGYHNRHKAIHYRKKFDRNYYRRL